MQDALGKAPICVGVMRGGSAAMLQLALEFSDLILASPFGKIEQAIFNHHFLAGEFRTPLVPQPNIEAGIATLGHSDANVRISIEGDRIVRRDNGAVIPVVHMYDRLHETNVLAGRLYSAARLPDDGGR